MVSLSEVMNRRDETVRMEVETGFSVLGINGVAYPVRKHSPVHLEFVSPAAKRVRMKAFANYVLSASCDRCLKEVLLPFEVCYEGEVDFTKSVEERIEEMDGISCLSGYDLDVDQLVLGELLMAFPAKVLCKEDCLGICSVCGQDRNVAECSCGRAGDTGHLDPRMAVVRDIFNNFKQSSPSHSPSRLKRMDGNKKGGVNDGCYLSEE